MTNIRKTAATTAETATAVPATETTAPAVVGPPLRNGQEPTMVTFAHHLRIAGRDFRPGESTYISPDYARQLRSSGYLARGRA